MNALRTSLASLTRWLITIVSRTATRNVLTRTCGHPRSVTSRALVKSVTVPPKLVTTAITTSAVKPISLLRPRRLPDRSGALEGHLLRTGALEGHLLRVFLSGRARRLSRNRLLGLLARPIGLLLQAPVLLCAAPLGDALLRLRAVRSRRALPRAPRDARYRPEARSRAQLKPHPRGIRRPRRLKVTPGRRRQEKVDLQARLLRKRVPSSSSLLSRKGILIVVTSAEATVSLERDATTSMTILRPLPPADSARRASASKAPRQLLRPPLRLSPASGHVEKTFPRPPNFGPALLRPRSASLESHLLRAPQRPLICPMMSWPCAGHSP